MSNTQSLPDASIATPKTPWMEGCLHPIECPKSDGVLCRSCAAKSRCARERDSERELRMAVVNANRLIFKMGNEISEARQSLEDWKKRYLLLQSALDDNRVLYRNMRVAMLFACFSMLFVGVQLGRMLNDILAWWMR